MRDPRASCRNLRTDMSTMLWLTYWRKQNDDRDDDRPGTERRHHGGGRSTRQPEAAGSHAAAGGIRRALVSTGPPRPDGGRPESAGPDSARHQHAGDERLPGVRTA